MVGSSALGIASGNGTIRRLGDGAKKYAVLSLLPFVDLLLLESGRGGNREQRTLVALWLGALVFCDGNPEQTVHSHVAGCAWAVCLVAERTSPVAGPGDPRSVCADFSARQRLDDLGTEVPCWCDWSRVGPDMAGAPYHRGPCDLVLPWQTDLAPSAHFYLSAVGD